MVHVLCRTVVLRKDRFDEREADFYEALYTQSQAAFGSYVEAGTVLNNYGMLRPCCTLELCLGHC